MTRLTFDFNVVLVNAGEGQTNAEGCSKSFSSETYRKSYTKSKHPLSSFDSANVGLLQFFFLPLCNNSLFLDIHFDKGINTHIKVRNPN